VGELVVDGDRMSGRRPPGRWSVVEHQFSFARAYWRSVLITGVLTPLLYVVALGIGLGTLVNRHGHIDGVPYLVYVAPAFLVAAALQTAAGESSWPIMAGFKWIRTFHGMAATPLTPTQIADGMALWLSARLFVNATLYLGIMSTFGAAQQWQIVFVVPAATFAGVAFAAPVMALAATVPSESQAFNMLFRFVVTPMFLFSGTFYPISKLPEWGQWLAHVSPMWHGIELARDAAIGRLPLSTVLEHIGYLLVWLVVGVVLTRWRFRVKLEK
jgi:lipooligosaccharide transport system permease protein